MENALKTDSWLVIEDQFQLENQHSSESDLGIGNGKIGQTGNFEEYFSGITERKTYLTGIYINQSIENSDNKKESIKHCINKEMKRLRYLHKKYSI